MKVETRIEKRSNVNAISDEYTFKVLRLPDNDIPIGTKITVEWDDDEPLPEFALVEDLGTCTPFHSSIKPDGTYDVIGHIYGQGSPPRIINTATNEEVEAEEVNIVCPLEGCEGQIEYRCLDHAQNLLVCATCGKTFNTELE